MSTEITEYTICGTIATRAFVRKHNKTAQVLRHYSSESAGIVASQALLEANKICHQKQAAHKEARSNADDTPFLTPEKPNSELREDGRLNCAQTRPNTSPNPAQTQPKPSPNPAQITPESSPRISQHMFNSMGGKTHFQGNYGGFPVDQATAEADGVGLVQFVKTKSEETAVSLSVAPAAELKTAVETLATVEIPPQLIPYIKNYQNRGVFAQFRFYALFKRDNKQATGPGWFVIDDLITRYTKAAETKITTRGNFWKMLHGGEGIFWQLDKENGRLFLRGWHSTAAALGCQTFNRLFVDMPLDVATAGIKRFRAGVYAAALSLHKTAPISKTVLSEITGLSESSLYEYDALLKKEKRLAIAANYQIARAKRSSDTQDTVYNRPWSFEFIDFLGVYFSEGAKCIAWQLPNTYAPVNAGISKRRKQARHQTDPETYSTRGNGDIRRRMYYDKQEAANKAHNKDDQPKLYPALRSASKTSQPAIFWQQT